MTALAPQIVAVDTIWRLGGVTLTGEERKAIRKMVGAHASCPVVVVPESSAAPSLEGESWHYETKGGTPIRHPNAYSKRGWSNMVYVASTLHVEVGVAWIFGWRHGA